MRTQRLREYCDMDLVKLLHDADGGAGLAALGRSFGLSADQTGKVVASIVPQMAQRLERNTLSRGGVADLVAMMGAVQAAGTAHPDAIGSDAGREHGEALLEQMFGTRDQSRAVAAKASYATGIGDSIIKAMLPYIASMVINAVVKRTSGGLGDILSKLPNMGAGPSTGGGRNSAGNSQTGPGDIFSKIPNIGGNAPINAPAGGPSPAGYETGGGFGGSRQATFPGGGAPLPVPQGSEPGDWAHAGGQVPTGRNPYGDLSDVIRRGGAPPDASGGGGALWRIVRGLVGGVLGFQSRGVMGWLVRLIVFRFGANILRSVLRRMMGGR
jgi:hypothetical protein